MESQTLTPFLVYRNFDLEISRQGDQLIARVLHSSEGEDYAEVAMAAAAIQGPGDVTELAGLDEQIGHCLLAGAVAERWAASTATAEAAGEGVRLRLMVQDESLSSVFWEAAKAGGKWLALRPQTPVVRYVPAPRPPETLSVRGAIRLLVVVGASGIEGLPELDVENEQLSLNDALKPLVDAQRLEVETMAGVITRRDLQDKLRRFRPHLLHYIGHGAFDPLTKRSYLLLARAQADSKLIAYQLGTENLALLLDGSTVRFAFLNACRTAEAAAGMAGTLVRVALPAALGMRTDVPDQTAAAFAGAFYRALADGLPVDAAVVEGRKLLATQHGTGSPSWAIPILYMRSHDGTLFEIAPGVLASRDATSARQGFLELARLTADPGLKAAIIASEGDLSLACQQIETLNAYKRIHDLFQQLQDRFRVVEEATKRVPTDDSAWDSLLLDGPELKSTIDELIDNTRAAPFATDEATWLGQLEAIRVDLQAALDDIDYRQLDRTLQRLDRVIARVPVHINERLIATAQGLRLSAIVEAVQSLLDLLRREDADNATISQLEGLATGLTRLDANIRTLAIGHKVLQRIDDDLRFVQRGLDQTLSQLNLHWPDIAPIGMSVYGDNHRPWAVNLLETHGQVSRALDDNNPIQTRRAFGRYRSQISRRFNQVDVDLHSICSELQRTAGPLGDLLRSLR